MRDDLQSEYTRLVVEKAIRDSPLPTWLPATVIGFNATTFVTTCLSDEPGGPSFDAQNITGLPLDVGQRVMVRFVSPAGAFVDGIIGDSGCCGAGSGSGVPTSRTITAGVALSGGGDLSADRTIDHDNTAVTPGTYGDASHVAQVVVDQQGHVTGVSNVAITGTGGGGVQSLATPVLYNPGSDANVSAPNSNLQAVDSTNLTISFTLSATTNVVVVLSAVGEGDNGTSADFLSWGLLVHGTSTQAGALYFVTQTTHTSGTIATRSRTVVRVILAGLTAGSYQYDFGHKASGGSNCITHYGGPFGPATMEVYTA